VKCCAPSSVPQNACRRGANTASRRSTAAEHSYLKATCCTAGSIWFKVASSRRSSKSQSTNRSRQETRVLRRFGRFGSLIIIARYQELIFIDAAVRLPRRRAAVTPPCFVLPALHPAFISCFACKLLYSPMIHQIIISILTWVQTARAAIKYYTIKLRHLLLSLGFVLFPYPLLVLVPEEPLHLLLIE